MAEPLLAGRQLFIFDLDGTIADTDAIHASAFADTFAPLGIEVDYTALAGLPTEAAVDRICAVHAYPADRDTRRTLASTKRRIARARIGEGVSLLEGAAAFIAAARQHHRVALCTSGSRANVLATLDAIGMTRLFDPLVTGDDVAAAKPAAEGYAKVLALSGVAREAALVFEDSIAGVAAAEAAAIDVITVGRHGTDWLTLLKMLP